MLNLMRTSAAIGMETLNSDAAMTEEIQNPEENIEEMEEGELPEEGEICDDDDPKGKQILHYVSVTESGSAVLSAPTAQPSTASAAIRKPRDFDREEVASARGREGDVINTWKNIMSQRTKAGSMDANEEYYGYGKSSPKEGSSDKDYRTRNGESGDKDYRWGAVRDEGAYRGIGQDAVNEYGDSDYRSSSPRAERRRRRSPSPPYAAKRGRGHSPPFRGGYRGRGFRGGHFERQICKFFREGYCRDGDKCAYSHDAADSHRKAELCKFYQQGFCKKNLHCNLLHGEYPCKAFHKGECTKDQCQFSHEALNDFTKPIFEQMLKDDELASRIAIPQGPLKRRVLLPGGPSNTSPGHPGASPILIPSATTSEGMQSGIVPPPSVVVPTLSTSAAVTQPQLVLPPGIAVPRQSFPTFFPHHVIAASGGAMIDPAMLAAALPGLPMPPPIDPAALAALSASAANAASNNSQNSQGAKKDDLIEDDEDGGFNVNKMLERITSKVKGLDDDNDDSPASPPMYNDNEPEKKEALTIPNNSEITWKLHQLDEVPCVTSIDPIILQKSLTDSRLRNDPRIKKLLASQFDAFTNTLMTSSVPSSQQGAVAQQSTSAPQQATAALQQPPAANSSNKEGLTGLAKPVDPRMANRDPRKRMTSASRPTIADPRLSVTPKPFEPTKVSDQTNGSMQSAYSAMIPTTSVGNDQLYAPISPDLGLQDRDHRLSPQYRNSPPQQDDRGYADNRRGSYGNSWMPQLNSSQDFHNVARSVSNYGTEFGNQDRDERQLTSNVLRPGTSASPPKPSENSAVSSGAGPVSLREKRKNNEYESPLSRLRWGP